MGVLTCRGRLRRDAQYLNGWQKAITALGEGFDEAWIRGGIPQNFAELVDDGIQAVVEVDESIPGPKLLSELFAADDLAGVLQKNHQNLERLVLQAELHPGFSHFAAGRVSLEYAKAEYLGWLLPHRRSS